MVLMMRPQYLHSPQSQEFEYMQYRIVILSRVSRSRTCPVSLSL